MHSMPTVAGHEGTHSPPRTRPDALSPGANHSFTTGPIPFSAAPAASSFTAQPPTGSFKALGTTPGATSFQTVGATASFTAPEGSFSALTAPRLPTPQLPSFTVGQAAGVLGPAASPGHMAGRGLTPTPIVNSAMRPLKLGSVFGGSTHGQGPKGECQDQQCAEEECDPEECGDETRGPRDDNYTCGIDRRPMLPVVLVISTLCGALQNMMLEFPMLRDMLSGAYWIRGSFMAVYLITLGCMAFCLLFDPGLLSREERRQAYAKLQQTAAEGGESALLEDEPPLPKRAHKAWLYSSPIRRYDHFCRWLTNCIGLLNHREFILMLWGLTTIGVCGGLLDICLLLSSFWERPTITEVLFILLHLGYSAGLTIFVTPIFRIHIGLVSRNELCNEWKTNSNWVVTSRRTGKVVPVGDLSDDEHNDMFDYFEYDKSRNPWDKGTVDNCLSFWFTPRWAPGQLGEF